MPLVEIADLSPRCVSLVRQVTTPISQQTASRECSTMCSAGLIAAFATNGQHLGLIRGPPIIAQFRASVRVRPSQRLGLPRSQRGRIRASPYACIGSPESTVPEIHVSGLGEGERVSQDESVITSFQDIEQLIEMAREHDIADLRLEHEGVAVEISLPGGRGFKDGELTEIPVPVTVGTKVEPVAEPAMTEASDSPEEAYEEDGEESDEADENYDADDSATAAASSEEQPDADGVYSSDFVVTSNRVGFFFSGGKGKPPLVNVDDHVAFNQPVCIIDQLGQQFVYLSEVSGTVVKIFVEDGDAVEYGTKIMVIRPD